ncbi:hypothetical protein C1646_777489, partial [Rhizophagus diaphanus]
MNQFQVPADIDKKILTHFVRICSILVGRIVQSNLMDEAHQKLVEIVKIIEQNYVFFFRAYEWRASSRIVDTKGLDILDTRPSVESLIAGCEVFLGEILDPSSEKVIMSSEMLDIMVDYYNATYPANNFQKPFEEGPEDSIIIHVKMNQFERCRIGSEIFSSKMSSRHVKSSFITAKFITIDDDVDVYPSQVQYYFTHTVDLLNGPAEHFLAYIRWYKHAACFTKLGENSSRLKTIINKTERLITHFKNCRNFHDAYDNEEKSKVFALGMKKSNLMAEVNTNDLPNQQLLLRRDSVSSCSSLSSLPSQWSNHGPLDKWICRPLSTAENQKFHHLILRVTISCGFLLNWVNNSEVIELFKFLNPEIKLPDRKTLSNKILGDTVEKLDKIMLEKLKLDRIG